MFATMPKEDFKAVNTLIVIRYGDQDKCGKLKKRVHKLLLSILTSHNGNKPGFPEGRNDP